MDPPPSDGFEVTSFTNRGGGDVEPGEEGALGDLETGFANAGDGVGLGAGRGTGFAAAGDGVGLGASGGTDFATAEGGVGLGAGIEGLVG